MRVDDSTPTIDDLTNAKNNKFDLDGHLYVGGVRKTMYPSLPKHVHSQHGFVGCLGSLDFNGYLPHLLREASQIHDSVGDGCRGNYFQSASFSGFWYCFMHIYCYKLNESTVI